MVGNDSKDTLRISYREKKNVLFVTLRSLRNALSFSRGFSLIECSHYFELSGE